MAPSSAPPISICLCTLFCRPREVIMYVTIIWPSHPQSHSFATPPTSEGGCLAREMMTCREKWANFDCQGSRARECGLGLREMKMSRYSCPSIHDDRKILACFIPLSSLSHSPIQEVILSTFGSPSSPQCTRHLRMLPYQANLPQQTREGICH